MNVEEIRDYCLLKKGATESFPFDKDTLVFKVAGKMFALLNLEGILSINLKCEPEKAIDLRENHSSVKPGYHMNKKTWITVNVDDLKNQNLLYQWIDHSYEQVINGLTKKQKSNLDNENSN